MPTKGDRLGPAGSPWSAVLVVVLLLGAGGLAYRVVHDQGRSAEDPVISLADPSPTEAADVVHGTLTFTDDCFSVADGLVVWPPGTEWDPDTRTVHIVAEAADVSVGEQLVQLGTLLDAIPSTPTLTVTRQVIDALGGCASRTGIRSVVIVG